MATEIIEKNCLVIMKELKQGQFTRRELEFLESFFQALDDATKNIILTQQSSEQEMPSEIWTNEDEVAEIERQITKDACR